MPSPYDLNCDSVSSWLPSTPSPVKGSVSGSPQTGDVAELVSESDHEVMKYNSESNYYIKTRYVLPRNIFPEPEGSLVKPADDMSTARGVPPPRSHERQFWSIVRKYYSGARASVGDVQEWLREQIYKIHWTWNRLIWTPQDAYKFPLKFKKLVRMFLLDRNYTKRKFEAAMIVFRYMTEKKMNLFTTL